jgi:hypothetical protein
MMDKWEPVKRNRRHQPATPESRMREARDRFGPVHRHESWEEYAEHSLTHDDLSPNTWLIAMFSRSKGE